MSQNGVYYREELIFLLNQAAELEHSLCCSYLFTAFTLKDRPEEGLTEKTLPYVERWKKVFNHIAVEEMMHLAVVNNLLVALGAAPHFDRPNFPHDTAYYMPGLLIELQPFSETTMQHYIAVEQPLGSNIPYPETDGETGRIEGDRDNDIGPDPHEMESQGDLYGMIAHGLQALTMRLGEENVFIGPPPRTAFRQFLESSGWRPTLDRASTSRALARIVEQGEGASGDNPDSHYWKFRRILDEFRELRRQDPAFEPARPVVANPFTRTPPEAQGEVNIIDSPLTVQVSDLFNEAYGVLLQLLGRFFALTEETDAEGSALVDAAIGLMYEAVKPLGELLTRMPAGPSHPGRTAGPSYVVRTMHALPYKDSAWRLIRERLQELSDHAAELAGQQGTSAELAAVGQGLRNIAGMLEPTPSASA